MDPEKIVHHKLVPEHHLLSEEEAKEVLKRKGLSKEQLPKITTADPMIQYLSLVHGPIEPGSVIKIVRQSPTAKEFVAYRVVIKATVSNNLFRNGSSEDDLFIPPPYLDRVVPSIKKQIPKEIPDALPVLTDVPDPIQSIYDSALSGSADDQYMMGDITLSGVNGITRCSVDAATWYHHSANNGNSDAMWMLGRLYEKGIGVKQSDKDAFLWFSKSAEAGNPRGINDLGWCYEKGLSVKADYEKAFDCYSRASEMGYSGAFRNLGYMYKEGLWVDRSINKALDYYRRAVDLGSISAYSGIGHIYREKEDYMTAAINFRKAADKGYLKARYSMSVICVLAKKFRYKDKWEELYERRMKDPEDYEISLLLRLG